METLLNKIKELEVEEKYLRSKIDSYLAEKYGTDSIQLSGLYLTHQIHERPLSYMVNEFGNMCFYNGKGYLNNINQIPMSDLKKIVEKL